MTVPARPTSALQRFDNAVALVENVFLAVSHGIVAALVVIAVVFRYFIADPLIWTEEFIVIVFTWMLFVGFASGFRERMHLRIDALLILLPVGARFALGAIATAATLATLAALVWFGTAQAMSLLETQTPMMRISAAWAVTAVPIGALLSLLHIVRHAVDDGIAETLWPPDLIAASVETEE
jgi:TRAP-type C4-dicarboxylate transport system permease small subunit